MHTDEMKQAIKNDDFLTFRKLLKKEKLNTATKTVLTKAIKSYVGGASQETYLSALRGLDK